MVQINKLTGYTPFEEFGVTAENYEGIDALIGKDIEIVQAEAFTNMKGSEGVYVLFRHPGETALHYFTTHAAGIIGKLTNENVKAVLDTSDEVIDCKVVQRKSKTSDRMVITLE